MRVNSDIFNGRWVYHFDDLPEGVQQKVIERYFKGEILDATGRVRGYFYTKDGRIIRK